MRADLALIFFLLSLTGGIILLALRKKRGGAPLLIGGIVLRSCAGAVSRGNSAAGAGRALKNEKISQDFIDI